MRREGARGAPRPHVYREADRTVTEWAPVEAQVERGLCEPLPSALTDREVLSTDATAQRVARNRQPRESRGSRVGGDLRIWWWRDGREPYRISDGDRNGLPHDVAR